MSSQEKLDANERLVQEHQIWKLGRKRMGVSMGRQLRNWSMDKSRRETDQLAMIERSRLPVLPALAVLMKPKHEPAAIKSKFFVDEDDFLSIESSLESSEHSDC